MYAYDDLIFPVNLFVSIFWNKQQITMYAMIFK